MDGNLQTLIANVGFPIAISMYLLVRIEGKLSHLTDSINELSKNIINIYKYPYITICYIGVF
ncbi:MAG: YvrJ family protein [Romboutsia sp.]|uniref:YvrJ family protein n=1 Tax=Romboutsia sp. TaxID=1965302 RepID=UPI003F41AEF9